MALREGGSYADAPEGVGARLDVSLAGEEGCSQVVGGEVEGDFFEGDGHAWVG